MESYIVHNCGYFNTTFDVFSLNYMLIKHIMCKIKENVFPCSEFRDMFFSLKMSVLHFLYNQSDGSRNIPYCTSAKT